MKKLKESILAGLALMLIVAAMFAGGNQEASGPEDYGRFDSVAIRANAEVILEKADQWSVEAEIPRRLRNSIEIRNQGGTLVIRQRTLLFSRPERPRFIISMPSFEELSMGSSGTFRSEDAWEGNRMRLQVSGSGDMRLRALSGDSADLTTSGSGGLRVGSVEAENVQLHTSGSGGVDVDQINAEETKIRTSGSGTISCALSTGELEASTSGSGGIRVSGDAEEARIRTSGSGSFRGGEFLVGSADISISGSGSVRLQEGSGVGSVRSSGSGRFSTSS